MDENVITEHERILLNEHIKLEQKLHTEILNENALKNQEKYATKNEIYEENDFMEHDEQINDKIPEESGSTKCEKTFLKKQSRDKYEHIQFEQK